ncbi:hypothetical protein BH09ACT5_BH09ACT5_01050 [soil metagenome]
MNRSRTRTPEGMPLLSPGRHRTPRQGACFMEFASYLAGERWSDHPACTHATVAALARAVNDVSSDAGRSRLTALIPRVVGLTSDNPRLMVEIALRAARAGLPIANLERQRALAVAILSFDPELGPESREALAQSPDLETWARGYIATSKFAPRMSPRTAEAIVNTSVSGIGLACVDDPDARLYALLVETIEAVEATRQGAPAARELAPVGA